MTGRPAPRASATVRVARGFAVAPQQLFGAWLDAETASRWLFATATQPPAEVDIDARVPGGFRFVEETRRGRVEHRGEYLELVPGRRLVFTLRSDASPPSRVTVDIHARARGSRVVITQEDVDATRASNLRSRWLGMLYGLREAVVVAKSSQ